MAESNISLNDINLKVADLLNSKHPEHHALAEKCREVLQGLIDQGKPFLRLMTTPHEMLRYYEGKQVIIDCIELGVKKPYPDVFLRLFLTDEGKLLEITQFDRGNKTLEIRGEKVSLSLTEAGTKNFNQLWETIPFAEMVSNLKKALAEARNRHSCLVEDVEEKMQILDRDLTILKGD